MQHHVVITDLIINMSWSKTAKPTTSFTKEAKPATTDNFVFQDGNNYVFQDGSNFIFDINIEGEWSKTAKPT